KGGFHGGLGGFFPTDFVVIIGVVGVIVFQWIGFELQTNASEEMENPQRDIPRAVYASGLISFLSYAIPILGVVLILSSDQLSNVSGFVTAGGLHSFFAAVLGLVISTTTFSYILIFPALITLRRKYPNVRRPFVIPGGSAGAWICVILATLWVLFATVFSIWPGLFTST